MNNTFFASIKKIFLKFYHKNLEELLNAMKKLNIPPYLLKFSRSSVARGVALGLFINFLPLPLQSIIALSLAVFFHANVAIAISLTWINNPFTFIPINFFIFKMGSYLTGEEASKFPISEFEWSLEHINQLGVHLYSNFFHLGKTYLLGLALVSIGSAIVGYIGVQAGWSSSIMSKVKSLR